MPFLTFRRDHLRSTSGIIFGTGSFAVQFGDHFRSGIIYDRGSFAALYSTLLARWPIVELTSSINLCTSRIEASPSPPRAFEFLENYCSNSLLTGPKSCPNAPTPGKITRLLFELFSSFFYASEAVHVNIVY